MKKYFLLAAAAATVLAVSCNKEKNQPKVDPTPNVVDEIDDTTPQPVLFGVNNAVVKSSISTKAAVDAWASTLPDSLYVLGLHNNGTVLINNVGAKAPDTNAGRDAIHVYNPDATAVNEPFYYGMATTDVYSFYGYYVGTAYKYEYNNNGEYALKTSNPTKPTLDTDYKLTVDFDGTTDIMLAVTDKEADYAARAPQYADKYVIPSEIYSAKAARRGVHPDLIFKHQLSRFVFYLQAANADVATHIKLDSLTLGSKYKVALDVDGNTATFPGTATDTVDFVLKDAAGAKVTNQALVYNATAGEGVINGFTKVGESIMVAPGQENYYMKLGLKSDQISATIPVVEQKIDLSELIEGATATYAAEAGKKYIVKMMVYGPEEVKITVTLVPWDDVDMNSIDPDTDPDNYDSRIAAVITVNTPTTTSFEVPAAATYQIEATSTNTAKKITYTSSAPSVATVDENGLVRGVTAGTADITLSQAAGLTHLAAADVVLHVTVTLPIPAFVGLPTAAINATGVSTAAFVTDALFTSCQYGTTPTDVTAGNISIAVTPSPAAGSITYDSATKKITVAQGTTATTYSVTLKVAESAGNHQAYDAPAFDIVVTD